jgi:hypothetical protein
MKRSHNFKSRRVLALVALFGAMVTTMLRPAYAQQEVDPTWYNPWVSSTVSASTATVQTTQPKATDQVRKAKIKTVSHQTSKHTSNHTSKNASKRVVTQTKPS